MSSVTYSSDGTVGTIRISRPERRNALNHAALDLLHESVRSAADDELRCLVLTGDSGHFCAGADLTELEDLAFTDDLRAALDALGALPFPTIAAIAGSCMGLGMQLALACDLRIATADARFAVPVAKLVFIDGWRAGGTGPGITWDNRNPFAATDHEPDRRIDYVFVGYPRDGGRGQVVRAELVGTAPVDGVWPSDHFGVVADLRA